MSVSAKLNLPIVGNLLGVGGSLRPALAIATFVLALLAAKDSLDHEEFLYTLLIAALSFSLQTTNSLILQAAFLALAILAIVRLQQLTNVATHRKVYAWFILGFAIAYMFA